MGEEAGTQGGAKAGAQTGADAGAVAGAVAGADAGAVTGAVAGKEAGAEAGAEVAVVVVDAKIASSGMHDVEMGFEMGLRKLGMPPTAAVAAAAWMTASAQGVAQQLSSSEMSPFQGTPLCQLPVQQALLPSARGLTAVELPTLSVVMTLTLTGTFATFDTADFKERLADRLQLQVQQIKVKKIRPKGFVIATSANAVDGIAVDVDEDNYLRCTGSGSLSDGSEASEDDNDYISSAIRVALKPIKVAVKDAITIEWVEAGSVIVCLSVALPLAIILMDQLRLRDPGLEALGLRSHVIGEQRKVAPPSKAELVAFDDVIRRVVFAPNHFEALGLPLSAPVDAEQVKHAYRALVRQVHPDKSLYDNEEAAAAAAAAAAAEATAAVEAKAAAEAAEAKALEAAKAVVEQVVDSEGAGEQSQLEQAVAADEPPAKKPRIAEQVDAEAVAPQSKLGALPAMKRLNAAWDVLSDSTEAARHLQACQGGMALRGAWEQDALEELRQLRAAHVRENSPTAPSSGVVRLIQCIAIPDPALGEAAKSSFPHIVQLNGTLSAEDEGCEWQQCKTKTTCIKVQLQDEQGAPPPSSGPSASRLAGPRTEAASYQSLSLASNRHAPCLWQASLSWEARCRRAAWSFS